MFFNHLRKQCFRERERERINGFTLIELLVVIAIIGLLASIVLVSLKGAIARANDARRLSDLKQISTALELYHADHGRYPESGPGLYWRSECPGGGGHAANNVIPGLVPKYLATFPSDPAMNKAAGICCYLYHSNGIDYKFLAFGCPETNYRAEPARIDPARDGGPNNCVVDGNNIQAWKVSSPGGLCW